MEIIISNQSSVPIYEQIGMQIKELILDGELKNGDMITSVRALARELGIGVLTVQKAYDKLQQEGIIETTIGKGTFIKAKNLGELEDQRNKIIEEKAMELIALSKKYSLSIEELKKLIELLYD